MKIALFTDTFLPQINGVTNTLSRLGDYLEAHNHEYVFLAPEQEEGEFCSYNVEKFFSMKFFLYPECRLSFPSIKKISRSMKKLQPDVIQLMTEFNMGIAGMNYATRHNIPVFSNYTTDFSKYLKYYNLQILENACWKYMQWFHNQAKITFCPSHVTKENLLNNKIHHVEVFGRGVDCEHFTRKKRSDAFRNSFGIQDKVVFLYVGRVSSEKDLNILLEAFKILNRNYKDEAALIITGDGPILEKYKNEYTQGIIYTGYKNGEALATIYASADVFAFPSPTETLGNVVIEGMASSLPVVGVYEGGVKENLIHGYNGLACKEKDIYDFYRHMEKILKNKSLRGELSHNAREYAMTKSWQEVFEKLLMTYEETYKNRVNRFNSIA
jgi:glycosyltransferase involved in cell wall biosynthesis